MIIMSLSSIYLTIVLIVLQYFQSEAATAVRPSMKLLTKEPSERDWGYLRTSHNLKLSADWNQAKGSSECGSIRQSPIDIKTASAEYMSILKAPSFTVSTPSTSTKLVNTGTTLQLDFNKDITYKFGTVGPKIKVEQIHWHWGSSNTLGSEHQVNAKSYPLEGHIVGYNYDLYTNFADAVAARETLYVLGIFYMIGSENAALKPLVSAMSQVTVGGANASISGEIKVEDFLPTNSGRYYRYLGSLTTPPCYSNVVWTVMADPVTVSTDQMEAFRSIFYGAPENGTKMVDNYRPVQSVEDNVGYVKRAVYSSFRINTSSQITLSTSLIFLSILFGSNSIFAE